MGKLFPRHADNHSPTVFELQMDAGNSHLPFGGAKFCLTFVTGHDRISLPYLSDIAVGGGVTSRADAALSGLPDHASRACAGAGTGRGGGGDTCGSGRATHAAIPDAAICWQTIWI
jgi:hypothetical protein